MDGKPKGLNTNLDSSRHNSKIKSYTVEIEGEERQIYLKRKKDGTYRVKLDDEQLSCELVPLAERELISTKHILHLENKAIDLDISGGCKKYHICTKGSVHTAQVEKSRIKELRKHAIKRPSRSAKGEKVICEMPGLIVKLEVKKGQKVKRGQGLAVIDAMKMENEILAPKGGKVIRITVEEGQEIDKGHLICCIK